ncbi:MAG TPA: hypothetical protein PLV45_12780 [bacterium]|nr:hypothetical protein [bacterium]
MKIFILIVLNVLFIECFSMLCVKWLEGPKYKECVNELLIRFDCDNPVKVIHPHNINVVCLGDSFTFGHLIEDFSDTWPAILDKKIENDDIKILNCGQRGYNSRSEVVYFSKLLNAIDIDLLIWQYLWNDVQPANHYPTLKLTNYYAKHPILRYIYTFKLYSYFFNYPDIFKSILEETGSFYNQETQEWNSLVQSMTRMKTVTDKREIPVVFVVYPNLGSHDYSFADPVLELAEKLGFETCLPRYPVDVDFSRYAVSSRDTHPNGECNEWFVESLIEDSEILKHLVKHHAVVCPDTNNY